MYLYISGEHRSWIRTKTSTDLLEKEKKEEKEKLKQEVQSLKMCIDKQEWEYAWRGGWPSKDTDGKTEGTGGQGVAGVVDMEEGEVTRNGSGIWRQRGS